jgi:hypothetical protein
VVVQIRDAMLSFNVLSLDEHSEPSRHFALLDINFFNLGERVTLRSTGIFASQGRLLEEQSCEIG